MNIQFIGVGAAFTTPAYYQSNLLITADSGKRLLMDCGTDARFALAELGIDGRTVGNVIDAVYISHLHADHIGGLEWLAFSTFFNPTAPKPHLFIEERMMQQLWECSLRGGLGRIEGRQQTLTDYFNCQPLAAHATFHWEKITFTLIPMLHVDVGSPPHNHYSYGLLLNTADGPRVWISTDTRFEREIIIKTGAVADVIFHDCETTAYNTPVHAHYTELCTLPVEIKQKMWLYHYQPDPIYDPQRDGFQGFVRKGQLFDFSINH
ncbi:MBL fold metallo-hydrolase [Rhodoferax sp. 4810]|uniref:MBL fold metallo-hydrolase n=1 Tax=Thiospirillum jenense TaxID=1653858 RepID=A0A839H3P1_9GAMM|nr:MBL fold metallo-hydrolase [Thiospirillum jenense]MBB1072957.1 MBL fold metallo-hydrolase [Rhodoferax jenense]MBB1124903.1 MBL fold metallo-hydrolase [Thiospirillum jenense]